MLEQWLVVAVLVIGCTVYAAWRLLPAAGRRAVAKALLRLPLPTTAAAYLQKQQLVQGGCACDGCDKGKPGLSSARPGVADLGVGLHPMQFHPRVKR